VGVRRTAVAASSSRGVAAVRDGASYGTFGAGLHSFIGTWPQASEALTPRESGGGGLPWRPRPLAAGRAPLGPRWASAGLLAGPAGRGRAYGLGPIQKVKFCFFSKYFPAQKQFRKF
jgi:hypothetical protein